MFYLFPILAYLYFTAFPLCMQLSSRAAVPNLWYANPQGYVGTSVGVREKISVIVEIDILAFGIVIPKQPVSACAINSIEYNGKHPYEYSYRLTLHL